jgi:hypothetical protein
LHLLPLRQRKDLTPRILVRAISGSALALGLAVATLIPARAAAAEPPGLSRAAGDPAAVADAAEPLPEAGRYLLRTYPRRLWATARETYTGGSLAVLAAAGALVPLLDDYDRDVQADIRRVRPLGTAAGGDAVEVGEALGSPPVLFGASLLTAAAGRLAGSEAAVQTGTAMLEALSVAGVSTIALKLAVQRRRPDGSDTLSFPSNHASGSFAVATVLAGRLGWPAGVPAFLAAGFVSYSRLEADRHFLTDTLFGAVLGTAVGLAVLEVRGREGAQGDPAGGGRARWAATPFALPGGGGLVLAAWW